MYQKETYFYKLDILKQAFLSLLLKRFAIENKYS